MKAGWGLMPGRNWHYMCVSLHMVCNMAVMLCASALGLEIAYSLFSKQKFKLK